jgi:heme-degrading monooxygenase HmoA
MPFGTCFAFDRERVRMNKVITIMKAPGATAADYDKVCEIAFGTTRPTLEQTPTEGLIHSAGELDGKLVVVDVWESAEAFQSFGEETVSPALAKAGIEAEEPKVFPVYNLYIGGEAGPGSTGVLFKFENGTTEQYDTVMEEIFGDLDMSGQAPSGLITHAVGTTDNGLLVFDLWESTEAFQRFAERLGPVAEKAGLSAQPKIYQLCNAQVRVKTREPAIA